MSVYRELFVEVPVTGEDLRAERERLYHRLQCTSLHNAMAMSPQEAVEWRSWRASVLRRIDEIDRDPRTWR